MLIASKLVPGGGGLAPALVRRAAHVELDWDARQKSRFDATDSLGRTIGVFLARGGSVRGGDVLVCEDGSLVVVRARPQPVLIVRAAPDGAPHDLLRAAYHLGNRHVPLEVRPDHLQLEPDHVLAALLERMGLRVETAERPFEPEAGAYATAEGAPRAAAHDHGHEHGYAHDQGHGQAHGHDHDHAHGCDDGHAHGRDHGHAPGGDDKDHGHGHGHGH